MNYNNPYEMGTREYELFERGVIENDIGTDTLKAMTPGHVQAYLRGVFSVPFKERVAQDAAALKANPEEWMQKYRRGSAKNSTAPTQNTTTAPQASTSTMTGGIASDAAISSAEMNYLYSYNPFLPHQNGESPQPASDFISPPPQPSNTGIERLLMVQEFLELSGLYPVDSITIRFNAFDSGIQEITLSSHSGGFVTEKQLSSATNSE